jgi:hypothetical protein
LLPYASAVVRSEEVNIEVKDYDNTVYHIKKAITVINKNGDDIARIVLWYNKTNVIRNLKGTTYNEFGKPIGKFTERELIDESATASYSLFDDSRVKHFIPSIGAYPYTVEYEYELRCKFSLTILRDWMHHQLSPGLAVEKSTFTGLSATQPSISGTKRSICLVVLAPVQQKTGLKHTPGR